MKRLALGIGLLLLTGTSGCGAVMHEEMLTESIKVFSSRMKGAASEKIWVTGANDSACDSGCCGNKPAGKGGVLGGLFGGGGGGGSTYDKLAYEVFANYLTQRKKAAVVETHRHNYATEGGSETHRKVEVSADNTKVSTTSCEDLCLLDEAKKRKASKVLAYHIIEMKNDEMIIHIRLSDVASGVVELSHTLKVFPNMRAQDVSFGLTGSVGAPRARQQEVAND